MIQIQATTKWRRPKLTLEQKSLRQVFKNIGKPLKDEVRRAMPRVTGALYFSIAYKVKSTRQNDAYCVIGSKVRYGKNVRNRHTMLIPNKYIGKVEARQHVMARYTGSAMVALITQETAKEMEKVNLVGK